jgi:hypothetical protein
VSKPRQPDSKRPVPASSVSFDPDALDAILKEPAEKTLYDTILGSKPRGNKGYNRRRGDPTNE